MEELEKTCMKKSEIQKLKEGSIKEIFQLLKQTLTDKHFKMSLKNLTKPMVG